MTRHPAAYLRKSKDAATKAEHLDALMQLVHADGHNGDTEVYDDWAKSGGRGGLGRRSEWRRLCDDIEADQISAVYMNDLDRGGRDLEEWLRFLRVAQEHEVRVLDRTGEWTTPARRTEFVFKAWLAEEEYRRAQERSAFTRRMQQSRGDRLGVPPYGMTMAREQGTGRVIHVPNPDEPVDQVIAAVRETGGNVLAATRLLNARGVRARRANWSPKSVAKIVRREEPRLLRQVAPRTTNGELRAPAPLAKIVRCHCGTVMTPRPKSGGLYCYNGIKLGKAHGRYVARERHVYDLIRAETEGQREVKGRTTYTSDATGLSERKAALAEELRRLGVAYRAGAVDDTEFESETKRIRSDLDSIEDDISDLDHAVSLTLTAHGPVIHWDQLDSDPASVGDALRRLVREVRLDAEMKPVAVEWRRTVQPFTPKRLRPRQPA